MNVVHDGRGGFDILVVGGGHAGIEAALAGARLGVDTALVTQDVGEIGRMPCNPSIGGLGKGQLVRELDVLGGQMGLAIDATGIQFRILNRKKGPAVRSPRAQADKHDYQRYMQGVVTGQPGLIVIEGEVVEILVEADGRGRRRVAAVRLADGRELICRNCILCAGTFMRGLMHVGGVNRAGGREGSASVQGLSENLSGLGFPLQRLKTGTPPRLHRDSIDHRKMMPQPGDDFPAPFSTRTRDFSPEQILCHLVYTEERTHEIIRNNLDSSALFGGIIEGRGPRYCPSIEDKVVRFAGRDRHLLFLEPEGRETDEVYVNGLSTSLPQEIQDRVVRSIPGLEEARILRYGYAVEYDSVPSRSVRPTLESKIVDSLYLSGQVIGTSGYEEAAVQGLVAGVNAANRVLGRPPLLIRRDEGYIGVLVDDLVTKEIDEPYRMFTSRAEHRLRLRCDNVESRLKHQSRQIGLLSDEECDVLDARAEAADRISDVLDRARHRDPDSGARVPIAETLKRPDQKLNTLIQKHPNGLLEECVAICRELLGDDAGRFLPDVIQQVESRIKYAGYIRRQARNLHRLAHLDRLQVPDHVDYRTLNALSLEAREKLQRIRPTTLGEAGRIDGVRAGDLAVLTVLLERWRRDEGPPDRGGGDGQG